MVEVETQDIMRLRWIKILSGVNRLNICCQKAQINQVIYSQLVLATAGVNFHKLIKQYKYNKNGYGECNAFCEWYDEDFVKNKT